MQIDYFFLVIIYRERFTVELNARARILCSGKYRPGCERPNPRRWKANFRCAMNSLADVVEEPSLSNINGDRGYKVYRFKPICHTQSKTRDISSFDLIVYIKSLFETCQFMRMCLERSSPAKARHSTILLSVTRCLERMAVPSCVSPYDIRSP
jgi:hypothetical protein